MKPFRAIRKHTPPLLILGAAFFFASILPAAAAIQQKAVSNNAAADYSSGAHSVISVDPVGGPREVQNDLQPTISDLGLSSFGRHFYVIERFFGDNVAKYDIAEPATPIWQYSTMDENDAVASSNPHSLVFVSAAKAYLLRHNDSKGWIVNPGADTQAGFKTGVLDLSAYNDQDDFGPEMTSGVVVGDRLFVVMQRFNQNDSWKPNTGYVAVYDTATDTEIDTGKGGEFKGVPLPVKSPGAIEYSPDTGLIYVQGAGRYEGFDGRPAEFTGGIATIDPATYETALLVDDGDADNHPYGNISGMTILSARKGYFVGYAGWGDNTLYEFNPATGEVVGEVNDYLKGKSIAGMEAGATGDKNGLLWVTNATDAEIVIVDPADNSIDEKIGTNLNPQKVVFVTYGKPDQDDNENGVADTQEIQGDVDLDGDGETDEITETYKFFNNYNNTAQIAMAAGDNVDQIIEVVSIDATTAMADLDSDTPTDLPFGLLDFSLEVPPGSQASVTVYLPSTSVRNWYKYSERAGAWEDYTVRTAFSVMDDGRVAATLTFQDGGFGDDDGEANGIIVDPSGPGYKKLDDDVVDDEDDSGGGGGGGDCFIGAAQFPGTEAGLLIVLAACLGLLACLTRGKRA